MNDERPIEKLLRRFARKRRDEAGAPLELHPATRRLLQGEVLRQFPKPPPAGGIGLADWIAAVRRRWIYATAAICVLLVASGLVILQRRPPELAANRPDSPLAMRE